MTHMTQSRVEVRTRHASVNEDLKQQDWDLFGSFQVAAHRGRDQSAPPLQQTALQRRYILGQLRRGAAGVALLQSQRGVDGRRLLALPVPERCHAVSIRHQPGLYLVFCPLTPVTGFSSSAFLYQFKHQMCYSALTKFELNTDWFSLSLSFQ